MKLREIEASVKDGAMEIDIVITREKVLRQDWDGLYREMRDFREACGPAHVKAIWPPAISRPCGMSRAPRSSA